MVGAVKTLDPAVVSTAGQSRRGTDLISSLPSSGVSI